jgi:hypothetical protein
MRLVLCGVLLLVPVHWAAAAATNLTLIQTYAACTAPNTELPDTSLGGLACTPAVTESPYRMKKPGKLSLAPSSSRLRVSVLLPLVDDPTGFPVGLVPPFRMVAFSAHIRVRTTDDACTGGAGCTVVDRTINVPVRCTIARCSGSDSIDIGWSAGRRSVELLSAEVRDDQDRVLAVPGL